MKQQQRLLHLCRRCILHQNDEYLGARLNFASRFSLSTSIKAQRQLHGNEDGRGNLVTLKTMMDGELVLENHKESLQNRILRWLGIVSYDDSRERYVLLKKQERNQRSNRLSVERINALGADLAAAQLVLAGGGSCRLEGMEGWLTSQTKECLPSAPVDGLYVEGIRVQNMPLTFECLLNFRNLHHLKFLDLSYCEAVDDFSLSLLKIVAPTLLFLDISGCINITHHGMATLHHLRNLTKIRVTDMNHVANKEMVTAMLKNLNSELLFIDDVDFISEDVERDGSNLSLKS